MIELIPLFNAVVEVGANLDVGTGPAGARSIGEIVAVRASGERIRAELAGNAAADWMVRTGAIAIVDVRMTLRTDDGALVYMQYGGRLNLADREDGLWVRVGATFETGDERYAWLNAVQAIGKGKLLPGPDGTRIEYEFHEVR
ncbi:MAG: DUF3237 family protein [Sphingomonadales bacterium]|nr:DUF3237 family protein [Sphingomonadales bacterium]